VRATVKVYLLAVVDVEPDWNESSQRDAAARMMNRSWPVSLGSQLNGNLCRGRRIMTSGPFTTLSFAAAQRQAETRNGRAVRRSKVF
jgi:hypothetical protein